MVYMKLDGRTQTGKGLDSHEKALMAFTIYSDAEKWIKIFRKGTREEDIGKGIDIVVETIDMGKLFLQIKTSKKAKEKFYEIKRRSMIAVVVVERNDEDLELIWRRLRQALFELRAQIRASWKERNY